MLLQELADKLDGVCYFGDTVEVVRVADLSAATSEDLVFVLEPAYLAQLEKGACRAAVVGTPLTAPIPHIVVKNPRLALAKTLTFLYPPKKSAAGCHPMSVIAPDVQMAEGVSVGPFSQIGEGVSLGADTVIGERVSIGDNCRIGKGCHLYPGVVLYADTWLGDGVVLHAGTVIGSDGFGYVPDSSGILKIPHIGRVVVEDFVEIGANCTIDRGCLGETRIGKGTKIDNLVHVSHNTLIGSWTFVAAQCGFVGSAKVGSHVQMGGQVGVNRVSIGDGCKIGGKAGVTKDVPPNTVVSGFPAWDHREDMQKEAFLRRLYKQQRRSKHA